MEKNIKMVYHLFGNRNYPIDIIHYSIINHLNHTPLTERKAKHIRTSRASLKSKRGVEPLFPLAEILKQKKQKC